MITQFKLAFKDIRKNKWKILLFIFQMTIFLFFTIIILEQSVQLSHYSKMLKIIKNNNIIFFKDYLNNWEPPFIDKEIYYFFENFFDRSGNAYSVMENAGTVEFSQEHPDAKIVIGVGNFDKIFGIDKYKDTEKPSYVFIGSDVKSLEIGDEIKLGIFNRQTYKVDGRLEKGEGYVNKGRYRSLDDKVLVLTSSREVATLYQVGGFLELIQNIHITKSEEGEIDKIVEMANKTKKITLIPEKLNLRNIVEKGYNEDFINFIFFSSFLISMGIFIIVGLVSFLYIMIDRNFTEYVVHQIYGATKKDLYLRITIFVVLVVILPLAMFLAIPNILLLPSTKWVWWFVFTFYFITILFVSILSVGRLNKKDLTAFFRRDN